MFQIRAVLFDLDGVIVRTDHYHFQAWKSLADEQGWAFDEEVNLGLRGVSRLESLQVILEHNGISLPADDCQRLASEKNARYVALLERELGPQDCIAGAVALLDALADREVRLACCSSSRNARFVLDRLGLSERFDVIVDGSDISRSKPDPEVFLRAAEQLRLPPFHCLVVEDAPAGVEAGCAAKMKVLGVGTPASLPGADDCVTDYADLDIDWLLMTGRAHRPQVEPWGLSEDQVQPARSGYWETNFALSNGLLGLRGVHEEDDPQLRDGAYPGFFVNGVYGYEPYRHIWSFPGYPEHGHGMLNLADWRRIDCRIDGDWVYPSAAGVSEYRRRLDLRRGVLERRFRFATSSGSVAEVVSERFVSLADRAMAVIRYRIIAVTPLTVWLRSSTECAVVSQELGAETTRVEQARCRPDGCDIEQVSVTSGQQVGLAIRHRGLPLSPCQRVADRFEQQGEIHLAAGEELCFDKVVAVCASVDATAVPVLDRAVAAVEAGLERGVDAMLSAHEAAWAAYWELADVVIDGAPADQQAMRFNCFHLRASLPDHDRLSIGANSLTGDKYRGHVFWDTEMYLLPHYLYTEPERVRGLLMYRYHLLDRARERARQMQGRGALFSWNSISGEECGVVFEASTAEYHLQSAIAYGIWRYHKATGDTGFLFGHGVEIVAETARFLRDRGSFVPKKGDRFCLNVVCGPDEYGCGVNNNCYTNVMAQWHFRFAASICGRMQADAPADWRALCERIGIDDDEIAGWLDAADRMYIPFDEEQGIHAQDDSYLSLDPVDMSTIPKNTDIREHYHPLNLWRMQVSKQADVVLLMLTQGWQFDLETKRRNYDFYEARTNHGSSLSPCVHSIIASEVGYADQAYDYFRHSVLMDMADFKNNTKAGVHSAALGGTWLAVVQGFAGMRDWEDGLRFAPRCPAAWQGYRFQLRHEGSLIAVAIDQAGASFRLLAGPAKRFTVFDEACELAAIGDELRIDSASLTAAR